MILSLAQWAQATAFFTALRGSWYVYPTVMSLHLVGIAMFGGMVLMTDLRLLGWFMRGYRVSDLVDQLRRPKVFGLALVVTCGILMLGCKAEEYYYNAFFRLKLALLSLVLHATGSSASSVYREGSRVRPIRISAGPGQVSRSLSLILWASIACAGRGIGYIEPPVEKIHAQFWRSHQPRRPPRF